MQNCHVLIVDDDPKIRTLLRRCLEPEGCRITEAATAQETLAAIHENPDLSVVTLDLQLGSDDGLDIARRIRADCKVPIVMVTGKDDVIDKVVGLELGADDYITKPFHVREVVARLKAVIRRSQAGKQTTTEDTNTSAETRRSFDGLVARIDQFQLRGRDGEEIDLTSGEFKLLEAFLNRPNRILSREQLLDALGGNEYTPFDRTIDNQVARLRKKIERDPANPKLITTVRGVGYSLTCDVE